MSSGRLVNWALPLYTRCLYPSRKETDMTSIQFSISAMEQGDNPDVHATEGLPH